MRTALTTRECAELLNAGVEMEGAFTARFIWGEIEDGRLVAKVRERGATRQRARIRVTPEDFMAYCDTHYSRIAARVRALLIVAA